MNLELFTHEARTRGEMENLYRDYDCLTALLSRHELHEYEKLSHQMCCSRVGISIGDNGTANFSINQIFFSRLIDIERNLTN